LNEIRKFDRLPQNYTYFVHRSYILFPDDRELFWREDILRFMAHQKNKQQALHTFIIPATESTLTYFAEQWIAITRTTNEYFLYNHMLFPDM
jgi:hypothetical protein